MSSNQNTQPQRIDFTLIFVLLIISIISCVSIFSAQSFLPGKLAEVNFVGKQIMWYIIGIVAIGVTLIIDFDKFKQVAWFLYGFGILLLLGLEFNFPSSLVQTIKGATSWYTLPGIGNLQPSELMKIFLILVLSQVVAQHNEALEKRSIQDDLKLLGKIFATSLVPLFLVLKQPDLGTALVLSSIIVSIIVVSGIRWRLILGLITIVSLAILGLVAIYFADKEFFLTYILHDYQLDRFYGWLAPYEYPNEGYQLRQALLAIGSGELYGKGYMMSDVYFPEPHTDFIFAVIAEQFGFIGGSVVISLFFILVYRMIYTALETNDPFGSYLCSGVIGMITFQVFENIGMTIGVLPITGIPLPYISYGGSALLTYMIAIGIVLNVRSRTKSYMFD